MSVSSEHPDTDPNAGGTSDAGIGLNMEGEPNAACAPGAPAVLGAVIVAIGAVLLWQASHVPGPMSAQGPRFLPVVIAVAWTLLGLAYLAGALASLIGRRRQPAGERFDHLYRVIALLVVLVAYAYAIDPVGYLLSTALLFSVCAALLGSRNHIRDGLIAVVLATAIYLVFSQGLNIYLPPGILPI